MIGAKQFNLSSINLTCSPNITPPNAQYKTLGYAKSSSKSGYEYGRGTKLLTFANYVIPLTELKSDTYSRPPYRRPAMTALQLAH